MKKLQMVLIILSFIFFVISIFVKDNRMNLLFFISGYAFILTRDVLDKIRERSLGKTILAFLFITMFSVFFFLTTVVNQGFLKILFLALGFLGSMLFYALYEVDTNQNEKSKNF